MRKRIHRATFRCVPSTSIRSYVNYRPHKCHIGQMPPWSSLKLKLVFVSVHREYNNTTNKRATILYRPSAFDKSAPFLCSLSEYRKPDSVFCGNVPQSYSSYLSSMITGFQQQPHAMPDSSVARRQRYYQQRHIDQTDWVVLRHCRRVPP